MTVRRVALNNIAHASKREPKGLAERWYSTLKTSHRLLTIERKRGIVKNFCITPQNRYVFLADLKSAVRRVDPDAQWAALRTLEDKTGASSEAVTPRAPTEGSQSDPQPTGEQQPKPA